MTCSCTNVIRPFVASAVSTDLFDLPDALMQFQATDLGYRSQTHPLTHMPSVAVCCAVNRRYPVMMSAKDVSVADH